MALILIDGADDDLSAYKWTLLNDVLRSTFVPARTGPASLRLQGNTGFTQLVIPVAQRSTTMIVGVAYRFESAAVKELVRFKEGGTIHFRVRRATAGEIQLVNGAGTVVASSPAGQFVLGQFNYFEFKVFVDDVNGTAEVKMNNASIVSFAGDTRNGGTPEINTIELDGAVGSFSQNSTAAYMDDIYIANNLLGINNDYLSDVRVLTLYPDGNGNYSQWVGSDGNQIDNYQLVDEQGVPNTADFVSSGTIANKDSYTFTNVPSGIIHGLAQRSFAAKTDAGDIQFRHFQRIGGADFPSAVDHSPAVTPTFQGFSDLQDVSPSTGVKWTDTELNAAEFGIEVIGPPPVESTIFAEVADNTVTTTSTVYANVLDGTGSRSIGAVALSAVNSGQNFFSTNYRNDEYLFAFDTSGVVGTVSSVTLSLWLDSDFTVVDSTFEVREFNWGVAVDTGDYRTNIEFGALPLLASKASSTFTTGAYNAFTSEAAFLTAINQAGLTWLVLTTSRFRLGQTPSTTREDAIWNSADAAGKEPKLVVVAS